MFIRVPCTWVVNFSFLQSVFINFDSFCHHSTPVRESWWYHHSGDEVSTMSVAQPHIIRQISDRTETTGDLRILILSIALPDTPYFFQMQKIRITTSKATLCSTLFSKVAKKYHNLCGGNTDCALTCSFFLSNKIKLSEYNSSKV